MKTWAIGAAVGALVGVAVYLALAGRTRPTPAVPLAPAPAASEVTPAAPPPAVLAAVVDVTDIDALLDPPVIPVSEPTAPAGPTLIRVGFEEPAAKPTPPAADVPPIPPATEEDEVDEVNDAPSDDVAPPEYEGYSSGGTDRSLELCVHEIGRRRYTHFFKWEDVFRPTTGPLLLDADYLSLVPDTEDSHLIIGAQNFGQSRTFVGAAKESLLGPLVALKDWHIIESRAEGAKHQPRTSPTPSITSRWVPEPKQPDPYSEQLGRVYGVFNAANQAPATRLNWYTRWYGDARIPDRFSPAIVEEQRRIEGSRPVQLFFGGGVGLYGGS